MLDYFGKYILQEISFAASVWESKTLSMSHIEYYGSSDSDIFLWPRRAYTIRDVL